MSIESVLNRFFSGDPISLEPVDGSTNSRFKGEGGDKLSFLCLGSSRFNNSKSPGLVVEKLICTLPFFSDFTGRDASFPDGKSTTGFSFEYVVQDGLFERNLEFDIDCELLISLLLSFSDRFPSDPEKI